MANDLASAATFESLASRAMRCNACFESGVLTRSFVDLPQPRFVGPGYATSRPRIAWVMINPGAGSANSRDKDWRDVLVAFKTGHTGLGAVYAEQRRHIPHWNGLLPFIELHGLNVDSLALVNVAWCASTGNEYPKAMLTRCWERHTVPWLIALSPDVLILSGSAAHAFASHVTAVHPNCKVIQTFHYAHRPLDAVRARTRAAEVRRELAP